MADGVEGERLVCFCSAPGLDERCTDEETWREVIETNLRGTFNTCRAVARKMLRRRSGAIVIGTLTSGITAVLSSVPSLDGEAPR